MMVLEVLGDLNRGSVACDQAGWRYVHLPILRNVFRICAITVQRMIFKSGRMMLGDSEKSSK